MCHDCIIEWYLEDLALAPEWPRIYPTNYLHETVDEWLARIAAGYGRALTAMEQANLRRHFVDSQGAWES